jgi:hypothetical protein
MSASTVHYPEKLRLRVPAGLPEALRRAARLNHTSSSEWARQTLLRGLSAQGVSVSEIVQSSCAGPEQLVARVSDHSAHRSAPHKGEAA